MRADRLPSLWVTEERGPLTYLGMSTDMKRLFNRAEITLPDRCHIFRRTWAVQTVRQGIPRPYTQVMAG